MKKLVSLALALVLCLSLVSVAESGSLSELWRYLTKSDAFSGAKSSNPAEQRLTGVWWNSESSWFIYPSEGLMAFEKGDGSVYLRDSRNEYYRASLDEVAFGTDGRALLFIDSGDMYIKPVLADVSEVLAVFSPEDVNDSTNAYEINGLACPAFMILRADGTGSMVLDTERFVKLNRLDEAKAAYEAADAVDEVWYWAYTAEAAEASAYDMPAEAAEAVTYDVPDATEEAVSSAENAAEEAVSAEDEAAAAEEIDMEEEKNARIAEAEAALAAFEFNWIAFMTDKGIVVLAQRQDGGDGVYMSVICIGEDYMYYNVPEFAETYYYPG